jgi:hypothetical protein
LRLAGLTCRRGVARLGLHIPAIYSVGLIVRTNAHDKAPSGSYLIAYHGAVMVNEAINRACFRLLLDVKGAVTNVARFPMLKGQI